MTAIGTIFRRELGSYFATPLAYVFTLIFLVLAGLTTFYQGSSSNAARPTWCRSSRSCRGYTCC